jgi:hypothetical protein
MGIGGFTALHVALSLAALVVGIMAVVSLFAPGLSRLWAGAFLVLSVLVNITGFLFPFAGITPAFGTGIVASFILAVAIAAQRCGCATGSWRWIYPAGVVASLYFMVFVTIAQIFNKTPVLQETALSGAAFAAVQLLTLAVFVFLGIKAAKR